MLELAFVACVFLLVQALVFTLTGYGLCVPLMGFAYLLFISGSPIPPTYPTALGSQLLVIPAEAFASLPVAITSAASTVTATLSTAGNAAWVVLTAPAAAGGTLQLQDVIPVALQSQGTVNEDLGFTVYHLVVFLSNMLPMLGW